MHHAPFPTAARADPLLNQELWSVFAEKYPMILAANAPPRTIRLPSCGKRTIKPSKMPENETAKQAAIITSEMLNDIGLPLLGLECRRQGNDGEIRPMQSRQAPNYAAPMSPTISCTVATSTGYRMILV
jgi:hypothetical protein